MPGGQPLDPFPQELRQRGRGEEHEPQPGEEPFGQLRVGLQHRRQSGVPGRHVEVDRRADVAEIAQGPLQQARRRPAVVDPQGAPVRQHHVEVVAAAEGVAPGQPVEQDRWLLGQERPHLPHHLLVRAEHPVGRQHALGVARGPGREEDLDHGVRRLLPVAAFHRLGRTGAGEPAQWSDPRAGCPATGGHDLTVPDGCQRGRIGITVIGVDQARISQLHDGSKRRVVPALQRVRDADRSDRDAGGVGTEGQHQVLDRVAGQDHQGAAAELPVEQGLSDRVGRGTGLCVRDRAPALAVTLGREQSLRIRGCRTAQHGGDRGLTGRQAGLRPQQDRAVLTAPQRRRRRREQPTCRRGHRRTGPTAAPQLDGSGGAADPAARSPVRVTGQETTSTMSGSEESGDLEWSPTCGPARRPVGAG
jgi:hypothetical protein